MPRGDGSGPDGMGPMTGRALGYCAGYETPGFVNGPGAGRRMAGNGRGRGGRGFRNQYYATGIPGRARDYYSRPYQPVQNSFSKEDEVRMLREQSEHLAKTLEDVNKRLLDLEREE